MLLPLVLCFLFKAWGEDSCESVTAPPPAVHVAGNVRSLQDEAGLVSLHVATDGRRWQTSQVLPDRLLGELQTLSEPVAVTAMSKLFRGEELLVVLQTLQGRTKSFQARLGAPWQELSGLEDPRKARVTCLSNVANGLEGRWVALGHRGGAASLHFKAQGASSWRQVAELEVSHHDWESVRLAVLSEDGRLTLAASEDNVMLFYMLDEPVELKHLHGGASQVSAASIALLRHGAYLVVVAYQRGGLEGWLVDGPEVTVAWRMPRDGTRVVSWLHLAAASDDELPALLLACGDGERLTLWSLTALGELASPVAGRWSQARQVTGGLRLLHAKPARLGILRYGPQRPQWLMALAAGKDLVVLDALSGHEMLVTRQPHAVYAMEWR